MNILFFYPSGFGPQIGGGTEKVMETLSQCFASDGNSIFYVSFHRILGYNAPFPHLVLDDVNRGHRSQIRIEQIVAFVKENNIDIIIDNYHHNNLRDLKVIAEVKRQTGVKVICLYHTSPSSHELTYRKPSEPSLVKYKVKRSLKERLLTNKCYARLMWQETRKSMRFRLEHYDRIVLLSENLIPEAARFTGYSDKYVAIPNTIPSRKATLDIKKNNELLWVGRMTMLKQPEKALRVWIEIQDLFPEWSINFLGDGEMLQGLRAWSDGATKRCRLLGHQDPLPYYQSAKIFLMTSDIEGFGLVLVEAQREGAVPIAFDTFASLRDIVTDGEDGLIIEANNLESYKEQLVALMRDNNRLSIMSDKAKRSSERFSEECIIPKWYQLFGSLGLQN